MEIGKPISQNLKKFVKSLQSRKERQASNMFVVEGEKLCRELLESDFTVEFLVLRGSPSEKASHIAEKFDAINIPVYSARSKQFDQICNTKSPQDILAVVKIREQETDYSKPFIILDGINDPGNLGTIIRTADWFGFKHIILSGSSVDKYNAKTVRASMGSLFRVNVSTTDNLPGYLMEHYPEFEIYSATLSAVKSMEEIEAGKKFGLVFGSEAHGISAEVLEVSTEEFKIEGKGNAESLNVAISVGIVCYHFSKYI